MTTLPRFALRFVISCITLLAAAWTCAAQATPPAVLPAPTPAVAGTAPGTPAAQPDTGGAGAAPADAPPQRTEQAPETPPDGFKMGGFTFKPGGRIKLDVIRDFNPIGSEDSFDPRTIAVDGSS